MGSIDMNEPIETYKNKKGEVLKIYYETCPKNPKDWSNYGVIVCFHNRYNLGDAHPTINKDDFDSWDALRKYLIKEKGAVVILPLRIYDHSGISISTTGEYPYSDKWDSAQVGFIYTTKEKIKEMAGDKTPTKEKLVEYLNDEVKIYNQYLNGEVYFYQLIKIVKCNLGHEHEDVLDSCGGFYDIKDCLSDCDTDDPEFKRVD